MNIYWIGARQFDIKNIKLFTGSITRYGNDDNNNFSFCNNTFTENYLVLQLLKGEKELNVLAVENDIQPNLLRNWKKEFLTNASLAFDNKRDDNLREKLAEERKEKAEYAKKVGQLTMQVDWLKKNLKKLSDMTTRVNLVRNLSTTKELPVSTGAKLLGINRTSVYYGGIPVSEEELECKAIIDHLHTDNPTWGAR